MTIPTILYIIILYVFIEEWTFSPIPDALELGLNVTLTWDLVSSQTFRLIYILNIKFPLLDDQQHALWCSIKKFYLCL